MSNSRILQIHRETANSLKERYAALHHCMESGENADATFITDRSDAVDTLLAGWKPTNSTTKREPSIEDIEIEFPCAGLYESCRDFEITEEMLQQLKVNKKPHETHIKQGDLQQQKPLGTQQQKSFEAQQQKPFEMPQSSSNKKLFNVFAKKVNERGLSSTQESSWMNNQPSQSAASHEQREHREEEQSKPKGIADFRTAREELIIQSNKKNPSSSATGITRYAQSTTSANSGPLFNYGNVKKSLGARRTVRSGFVPPIARPPVEEEPKPMIPISSTPPESNGASLAMEDKRLANIDPKMVELITNEIMHNNTQMDWSEIAGLEYAKSIIKEAVVYPLLRPDIFTGLRRPPRGILLFGPPGTGKTLIGKCIASQSKSTFFTISASSLTSKWVGESEKMVRALFAVAAVKQPSVVFIDEIDSLLCQRSETEHESSRRLKTEFLVQLDGAATSDDDRILIIGATNRPQELDEAARRRFVKRLYIPLPEKPARIEILRNLLQKVNNNLTSSEVERISEKTNGFSGADMSSLCREASMEPIRSIPAADIPFIDVNNVRPVNGSDFDSALQNVRPSVSQMDLQQYTDWNRIYGSLQ